MLSRYLPKLQFNFLAQNSLFRDSPSTATWQEITKREMYTNIVKLYLKATVFST